MKYALSTSIVLTTLLALTNSTKADVLITANDGTGDLVITASGDLDITDAILSFVSTYQPGIIPGGSNWYIAPGPGGAVDVYELISVDLPFGTSTTFFDNPDVLDGDEFLINGFFGGTPLVGMPPGYVSGTDISSLMVFNNTTLADLTLIKGTYDFDLPNDRIRLIVGVPEPTSVVALTGVVGFAFIRRRWR